MVDGKPNIAAPEFHEATLYDAIVIGSGMGGATLAHQLVTQGLKTLIVQRGDYLKAPDPGIRASGDLYMADLHGERSQPFDYVGGETKFYGATLFRFRESDFLPTEHESGLSPGWPIVYSDLEPYYERAEKLYNVHGSSEGDPTEPPRHHPYPFPPLPHDQLVQGVVDKLRNVGAAVSALPKGLDYGPEGKCTLCPACDGYMCAHDAKMDAEIAAIRPAIATGLLHIATHTSCRRILVSACGRFVDGIEVDRNGFLFRIRCARVAVCSGVGKTAPLLRCSRSGAHPEGLGNKGGALGRYLGGQSMGTIFPIVGPQAGRPAHVKTFGMNGFYHGEPEFRFPMGTLQVTGQMPFWRSASLFERPIASLLGKFSLMCIHVTEALPTAQTGYRFDGDDVVGKSPPVINKKAYVALRRAMVQTFRRAGYPSIVPFHRKPYSKSEVGTARFGDDEASSVANPDCQVHGIRGLYIADATVLPSAGALNTGLTIAALAMRTGEKMAQS